MELPFGNCAWVPRSLLAFALAAAAVLCARFWRREARLSALEERYAALLAHRGDAVHHYHRAEEDGNLRALSELRPVIVRATEGLLRLQKEYATRFDAEPKTF